MLAANGGTMSTVPALAKHFLVASDFDQTLSFNDSGLVLSELIGASRFEQKVAALLHQVAASQSVDLLLESRRADEFAQHEPGVVETQGLIEIRCHEKVFT